MHDLVIDNARIIDGLGASLTGGVAVRAAGSSVSAATWGRPGNG